MQQQQRLLQHIPAKSIPPRPGGHDEAQPWVWGVIVKGVNMAECIVPPYAQIKSFRCTQTARLQQPLLHCIVCASVRRLVR